VDKLGGMCVIFVKDMWKNIFIHSMGKRKKRVINMGFFPEK
jgi:hypothetical protein